MEAAGQEGTEPKKRELLFQDGSKCPATVCCIPAAEITCLLP